MILRTKKRMFDEWVIYRNQMDNFISLYKLNIKLDYIGLPRKDYIDDNYDIYNIIGDEKEIVLFRLKFEEL